MGVNYNDNRITATSNDKSALFRYDFMGAILSTLFFRLDSAYMVSLYFYLANSISLGNY